MSTADQVDNRDQVAVNMDDINKVLEMQGGDVPDPEAVTKRVEQTTSRFKSVSKRGSKKFLRRVSMRPPEPGVSADSLAAQLAQMRKTREKEARKEARRRRKTEKSSLRPEQLAPKGSSIHAAHGIGTNEGRSCCCCGGTGKDHGSDSDSDEDRDDLPGSTTCFLDDKRFDNVRRTLAAVTDHTVFTIFDALLTFYVLLIPPFKDIFIPASADDTLFVLLVIIFVFFLLEIVVLSWVEKGYALRTYFWLDVIATASLVLDMLPTSTASLPERTLKATGTESEYINIERLAQLLGRLGRTVRLVRLFRQLRVLNVLMRKLRNDDPASESMGTVSPDPGMAKLAERRQSIMPPSAKKKDSELAAQLVEKVSDRMSRRVVVIILVSVVAIMLLQMPTIDRSREESVRVLHAAAENGTETQAFQEAISKFVQLRESDNGRLLDLKVNGKWAKRWPSSDSGELQEDELRYNQWERLALTTGDAAVGADATVTTAAFDLRPEVKSSAEYDIGIIVTVTIILFFFAILLSWDSVKLIQGPFRMMLRAERLSHALLSVFKMVAHSDDINVVSHSVVETAHQLLRCERVCLYFIDPVSKKMMCQHQARTPERLRTRSLSPNSSDSARLKANHRTGSRLSWRRTSKTRVGKSEAERVKLRENSILSRLKSFRAFSLDLTQTKFVCVQVANDGKARSEKDVVAYDGNEYQAHDVLVIPVVNASGKVVAVVEAVDKMAEQGLIGNSAESVGFDDGDIDTLSAFCDQLGAVIGRKALDAVFSSIMSSESTLDATARSLLQQYSGQAGASVTKLLEKDSKSNGAVAASSGATTAAGAKSKNGAVRSKAKIKRKSSLREELAMAVQNADAATQALVAARQSKLGIGIGMRDKLLDWDTSLFDLSKEELQFGFVGLMIEMDLLVEFNISRTSILNFVSAVCDVYTDVEYHNFYHGFNVFQVCYLMLRGTALSEFLERRDMLGLLVGAICHDMGHAGMNNGFHKQMYQKDPVIPNLALTYNDLAVLENMHASRAFRVMNEVDGCGIFDNISSKDDHFEARRMMCRGILATDMEHHMDKVKKLQNHSTFTNSRDDRTLLVEVAMHTADLSNPCQPWHNSSDWAIRVAKEFVHQYKQEQRLGLTLTPHFNVEGELVVTNPNVAKLNIGFVNYLVKPLWVTFVDFFPNFRDRVSEFHLLVCKHVCRVSCYSFVSSRSPHSPLHPHDFFGFR